MTGEELVTAVNNIIHRGTSADTLRYVNQALVKMARTGIFSHVQVTSSLYFSSHSVLLTYPTDLVYPVRLRYIETDNTHVLKYLPLRQFRERFPRPEDQGETTPRFYTRWGRFFIVNCPAIAYRTGLITGIVGAAVTGDADCLWATNGLIAGNYYYFKMDADAETCWLTVTGIPTDTDIALSANYAGTLTGGAYSIRKRYEMSLDYVQRPTELTGDATEQPFTGYDDLVVHLAAWYAFAEFGQYDKADQQFKLAASGLKDAWDAEGRLVDWDMDAQELNEGSNSLYWLDPFKDGA